MEQKSNPPKLDSTLRKGMYNSDTNNTIDNFQHNVKIKSWMNIQCNIILEESSIFIIYDALLFIFQKNKACSFI